MVGEQSSWRLIIRPICHYTRQKTSPYIMSHPKINALGFRSRNEPLKSLPQKWKYTDENWKVSNIWKEEGLLARKVKAKKKSGWSSLDLLSTFVLPFFLFFFSCWGWGIVASSLGSLRFFPRLKNVICFATNMTFVPFNFLYQTFIYPTL